MTDILRIVEKYTNHNGAPLSHPDLAQDITLLQNQMPRATAEEKEQAKEFLTSLMADIIDRIDTIKTELDGKAEVIDKLQKTTEACLAYTKPKGSKG